jgi:circadian clock protein KaiC
VIRRSDLDLRQLPDLFDVTRLSEHGVSHLADNVLVLQYFNDKSTMRRAIIALKTRASRNDPRMREFTIGPHGITLSDTAEVTRG